ncbi:DUF3306 domain-containing protein [Pseudoduganella buxea]|uniref:DUF3306 domain-containing protein n=1 Tax=Pseudoduganella buxea TaxID=1949069 RepID=A0A6I3T3N1_9BURK|nr:DUF3306 domain-containing protein [Pseudoduganella buxea]MTV56188.1 DUF3306 domain-containing protein [Pseudoduganella buxea]GGC02072.1 hypothetical protein GCM10011572_25000 [Pseudoduganella buxea]
MADGAIEDGGFLRRWSRLKAREQQGAQPVAPAAPPSTLVPAAESAPPAALPTLEDVARLQSDADFGRFVAPGVDATVRRLALKKMFADPHFNAMDGLDIYIGDYNKADPIPAAMMAALKHARSVFGGADETKDKPEGETTQAGDEPAQTTPAGTVPEHPTEADPASSTHADPAEPAGANDAEDPGTPTTPVETKS